MRQRILNNRAQPVELHLANGVVVIPAMGEVEVETEADEPQLEHLALELRVTILPMPTESIVADQELQDEAAAEESDQKVSRKAGAKRLR